MSIFYNKMDPAEFAFGTCDCTKSISFELGSMRKEFKSCGDFGRYSTIKKHQKIKDV